MVTVFLVQHIHVLEGGEEDVKVIGVYRSMTEARSAVTRLGHHAGFRDARDGFHIDKYRLNEDHWREGYVTAALGRKAASERQQNASEEAKAVKSPPSRRPRSRVKKTGSAPTPRPKGG